jgi:type I restriction enzyme, S subunit
MSELPENWVEITLEHGVEILDSYRQPVNSDERINRTQGKMASELFPYFGATGQVGVIDDYLFDESLVLLGEDSVPFFDLYKHKAYKVAGKVWINNHVHVLRVKDNTLDARFFTHYLNFFDYTGFVSGSTRLKLTQAAMRIIPIPLPPLLEQKRIADKLEE